MMTSSAPFFDDSLLRSAFVRGEPSVRQLDEVLTSIVSDGTQLSVVTCMASDLGPLGNADRPRMEVRNDPRGSYAVVFRPSRHANVVHLIATVPFSDYRWRKIERWLADSRTSLTEFWLDLEDLTAIGHHLEEFGTVAVSRTTGRSIVDGSSISRGWRSMKPSFNEAVDELLAYPATVRSITLKVGDRLNTQLRRTSGATIYGGDYELFEAVVLAGLAEAGQSRMQLLANRARRSSEPIDRGIAIRLDSDVFADPTATDALATLLYSDTELGVAVLHGNPYFHAAVTDHKDGSTFDVFVTSPDEVVILPGYRSEVGAISRLSDQIGERFSSVSLRETAASSPPTIEDLLGGG